MEEEMNASGISNGESTTPKRGRGRPKLSRTAHTQQQGSGDGLSDKSRKKTRGPGRPKGSVSKKQASNEKKRGRPKGSNKRMPEKVSMEVIPNGGSEKASMKRKAENITGGEEDEGSTEMPRKRVADGNQAKRGRGRPKGSLNKKPRAYVVHNKVGRPLRDSKPPVKLEGVLPTKKGKRGRPRKEPAKRGRPRKYPLPSPEELKKPKVWKPLGRPRKYPIPSPEELKKPRVWKPLGRPRKYPRTDPPEGVPQAPRRSRGRPRKSESKKGAHLRKSMPNDGAPRKRGRPPSTAKGEDGTPRKRGRPKGSVKKRKATDELQLGNSTVTNHSVAEESPAVAVEDEEQVEHSEEPESKQQEGHTGEMLNDQDSSIEISNRA